LVLTPGLPHPRPPCPLSPHATHPPPSSRSLPTTSRLPDNRKTQPTGAISPTPDYRRLHLAKWHCRLTCASLCHRRPPSIRGSQPSCRARDCGPPARPSATNCTIRDTDPVLPD